MIRRLSVAALLGLGVLALLVVPGCGESDDTPGTTDQTVGTQRLRATPVATFPAMVTALAAPPSGNEFLVASRSGVIYRLRTAASGARGRPTVDGSPVLDLSDQVTQQFDRGFLNMAFVDGGRSLVVMYTGPKGVLLLSQYDYERGEVIDVATERRLFALDWPYPFHHGGGLAVAASGDLYVGLGDKGLSLPGTPGPMDPALLLGGILPVPAAVLADRSASWSPDPKDFVARGLRNPWRMSFDAATGDLWIGDVGNLDREEIDRIPADDLGETTLNFGHPFYEGGLVKYPRERVRGTFAAPVLDRRHRSSEGQGNGPATTGEAVCGMVAGYVVRGGPVPSLRGEFVYSDLCGNSLRGFRPVGGRPVGDRSITPFPQPVVSLGTDARGALYAMGYEGGLFRIDPASWKVPGAPVEVTFGAPPSTVPVRAQSCGVIPAIEPFDNFGGMTPEELRSSLAATERVLAQKVPALPPDRRVDGLTIQRVFTDLNAIFASAGYDTTSPKLAELRDDLLNARGVMAGFPEALSNFFDSSCF
ncbi:MAG: PQQ-dependent sugar dehydrogenase [Actinomycetes bacterium]